MDLRVGQGYDVHRLVGGRRLILGGEEIPFDLGLEGFSDADVLLHARSPAAGDDCSWGRPGWAIWVPIVHRVIPSGKTPTASSYSRGSVIWRRPRVSG